MSQTVQQVAGAAGAGASASGGGGALANLDGTVHHNIADVQSALDALALVSSGSKLSVAASEVTEYLAACGLLESESEIIEWRDAYGEVISARETVSLASTRCLRVAAAINRRVEGTLDSFDGVSPGSAYNVIAGSGRVPNMAGYSMLPMSEPGSDDEITAQNVLLATESRTVKVVGPSADTSSLQAFVASRSGELTLEVNAASVGESDHAARSARTDAIATDTPQSVFQDIVQAAAGRWMFTGGVGVPIGDDATKTVDDEEVELHATSSASIVPNRGAVRISVGSGRYTGAFVVVAVEGSTITKVITQHGPSFTMVTDQVWPSALGDAPPVCLMGKDGRVFDMPPDSEGARLMHSMSAWSGVGVSVAQTIAVINGSDVEFVPGPKAMVTAYRPDGAMFEQDQRPRYSGIPFLPPPTKLPKAARDTYIAWRRFARQTLNYSVEVFETVLAYLLTPVVDEAQGIWLPTAGDDDPSLRRAHVSRFIIRLMYAHAYVRRGARGNTLDHLLLKPSVARQSRVAPVIGYSRFKEESHLGFSVVGIGAAQIALFLGPSPIARGAAQPVKTPSGNLPVARLSGSGEPVALIVAMHEYRHATGEGSDVQTSQFTPDDRDGTNGSFIGALRAGLVRVSGGGRGTAVAFSAGEHSYSYAAIIAEAVELLTERRRWNGLVRLGMHGTLGFMQNRKTGKWMVWRSNSGRASTVLRIDATARAGAGDCMLWDAATRSADG